MEESEIIKILISTGLKRNEILIYLDLVKKGKSSATEVSKRTGFYRSNTYGALTRLLQRGLINQAIENEKKVFYPMKPRAILDSYLEHEAEIKKIIPEIQKMQNIKSEDTRVTISKGANSVRTILLSLLESKEPIYAYGTAKEAYDTMGGFFDEFHRIRIEKKIEFKRIHERDSIHRLKKLNRMDYTKARYLPRYSSRISTHVCDNKVAIVIWDFPISTILIEDKDIADSYRNNFMMLWEEASDLSSEE